MRPSKAHFVTSCQQLLALGAVLAVLTPAASVVSLDVVRTPGSESVGTAPSTPSGAREHADRHPETTDQPRHEAASRLPSAPVDAVVEEVALTPEKAPEQAPEEPRKQAPGAPERQRESKAPTAAEQLTRSRVVSEPQAVTGYGAVGVTWSHADQVEDDRIGLRVRTATGGTWSDWAELEYHDEHAPDPTTEEGRGTRPGTDPLFVGEVDQVQLEATAVDGLPDDLSLAVVAPGTPADEVREAPAVPEQQADAGSPGSAVAAGGEGAIALQAAETTKAPRPRIYTREQWGANERLRDGRPGYGTISAGFVHHTVNANDYSRDDVPGMLRSIYAYHTQSRGWSDVGYNFLVDKFGRIWEGRYGGVARPVIGAHTLGYNDDSFAMSAIGNYETAQPSDAMLKAYGALFAWKLGLAGIDPTDMSQSVSGDTFAAINGHRDAGSTACPGRFLYAKIPAIRRHAEEASEGEPETPEPETPDPVTLEQVDSNLASTPHPDLVVRRESDGRGMVLPTGGLGKFLRPVALGGAAWEGRTVLATPDLTGDDVGDVVTRDDKGRLEVRPGPASGGYREVSRVLRAFRGHDLLASAGDLDADGAADLVARSGDRLVTFLGNARGGFSRVRHTTTVGGYVQQVGAGDVTGDGRADLWGRDKRDRLWLHRGRGTGAFAARTRVAGDWSDLDTLAGGSDYTADHVPDLVVQRSGGLSVLPSRGDGTLGRALRVGDATDLRSLSAAGQLTGGEAPDLLAVTRSGGLVAIPNRGTFDLGRAIDTGQSFSRGDLLLNTGDFDGDGNGDVVMRRKAGSLWLYRGRGNGRLTAPVWLAGKALGKATALRVVADVTGDGSHDLVGRLAGTTYVWPGQQADQLGQRTPIDVAPDAARAAVKRAAYDWTVPTSDLQGKGRADLVVRDQSGYLYRLNGVRKGYSAPRYLGEAGGFDLAG